MPSFESKVAVMNPWVLLLVVAGYFLLLIGLSYWTGREGNNADFFIGSRKSPWYLVAYGMIGASLSGVTFLSVPGWVGSSSFSYLQMVLGYFLGYWIISKVLLPVYYKMELTSIYGYLESRFGHSARLTGSLYFLLSRVIGASFRLYLVAMVLQLFVFDAWNFPFWLTVSITIFLIWVYTFKGGIRTIVWTDTLQTSFLLLAALLSVLWLGSDLIGENSWWNYLASHEKSQVFFWEDAGDPKFFWRQFFSGALITIVMTGLDQDMMQKNLSCKNLQEAQRNMKWFSWVLIGVNGLFLVLGLLLHEYAAKHGVTATGDALFPTVILQESGRPWLIVLFLIGLIAAAYSSADSALTALTTSFCVDILGMVGEVGKSTRTLVHIFFSVLLMTVVIVFRYAIDDPHVIQNLFRAAGFTYGPLLGMFAFGMLSKWQLRSSWWIPLACLLSPLISWSIDAWLKRDFGFALGFEVLALNGALTILLLIIGIIPKKRLNS